MTSVDNFFDAAGRFSRAPVLANTPRPIDVRLTLPENPDVATQTKFVGSAFEPAFIAAAHFVSQADAWAIRHAGVPIEQCDSVLDFGSGWGRITRLLLTRITAPRIYCLDVDSSMTALVQATLPGVNAITCAAWPPCMLRDQSMAALFSFSVFSHLAEASHLAWAAEFSRLLKPGSLVYMTVLDQVFFDQVAACQAAVHAGDSSSFNLSLARLIPDITEARAAYAEDRFIFAAAGEDGPRTSDTYGWAVAPRNWLQREWSRYGFELIEWIPSRVLFEQAMVCFRRVQ